MDRRRDSSDSVVNWFTGKRYRCIEIIGKGSYGQVVKSIDRLDNKFVAIKRMELRHDEPINMKRAYREIRILRHLHHPNIVALVDVVSSTIDAGVVKQITKAYGNSTCQQNYNHFKLDSASLSHGIPKNLGDLYLIFEFVDTDLSKIIKSNQYLSTEHVQYILFQILEGLLYLHKSNVLHRDLKPANILVSCADCSIKIADFGLARVVGSDMFIKRSVRTEGATDDQSTSSPSSINSPPAQMAMRRSTSGNSLDSLCSSELQQHHSGAIPPPPVLKRGLTKHVVTRWYRAPEVILSQPYSAAVDMWSVGCIFAELLGMLEVGNSDCRRRKALFPGDSCGELSAEEDVQLATKDGRRHSHSLLVPETEEEEVKPLRQGSTLTHSTLPDDDTLCSALGSLCGEGAPSAIGSDARPSLNRAGSSANSKVFEELYCYGSNRSQLSVIFEVIGTPGPEADLDFLGPGVAKALRKLKPRTPKDLKVMYPGADQSALDLLRSMLQFNPHLRISVEQALDHPFFTSLKTQDYVQQQLVTSQRSKGPGKVSLPPVLDASIEKLNESGDLLRHSVSFLSLLLRFSLMNCVVQIVQEIAFHRKREELLGTTR